MSKLLTDEALDTLFREARTFRAWLDKPVSDATLHKLYDLMKWGPTSQNCCPARIVFLRTPEAKQRLLPALSEANRRRTMSAPVTAIIAYDLDFYEHLPTLWPHADLRERFAGDPLYAEITARRNGSLQGGYLILAARAIGLDAGPMSGFDNSMVDREFFARGGAEDEMLPSCFPGARVRSNFLCNLGYGDPSQLHPRGVRLDFGEACQSI